MAGEGMTYPPGVDGAEVMRKTAEVLQKFARYNGLGDEIATAVDLDMIELRISGMGARRLLRIHGYWLPDSEAPDA